MTIQSQASHPRFKRIGGELPAGYDQLTKAAHWQANWLPFSHGRAALGWLRERQAIRSVAICAYTCPSVPEFFRRNDISIGYFDIGASLEEIALIAQKLEKPRMVLVPALFGAPPWIDATRLSLSLDSGDVVVIDAAQTAFGHMDFAVPPNGAVLSCPRKTTGLPDGAVLALPGVENGTGDLPVAQAAKALKDAARALWATGSIEYEDLALRCHRESEAAWPDVPHRMSETSEVLLRFLDPDWHKRKRLQNWTSLRAASKAELAIGLPPDFTPFSLPLFVENQQELLAYLRENRIYATALWPDAERDPSKHPLAEWCATRLVSLPIDQRHDEEDMLRVAEAVNLWAKPATRPPHQAVNPPSMTIFWPVT